MPLQEGFDTALTPRTLLPHSVIYYRAPLLNREI